MVKNGDIHYMSKNRCRTANIGIIVVAIYLFFLVYNIDKWLPDGDNDMVENDYDPKERTRIILTAPQFGSKCNKTHVPVNGILTMTFYLHYTLLHIIQHVQENVSNTSVLKLGEHVQ